MRNVLKAATLERKFPLLAVEHDCILSKDADLTLAYRVELPELFTVTSAEYDAILGAVNAHTAEVVRLLSLYQTAFGIVVERPFDTVR